LIPRGFAQGISTRQLADELECDYGTLLSYRHEIQAAALQEQDTSTLPDAVTESNEAFQNAGEKGNPHRDPEDPPRRRANKRRGKGTIQPEVEGKTEEGVTLYTYESTAYNRVAKSGREHGTMCHSKRKYARDDDGDGIREVHCNTMEGTWTGLRNFLRPFRGVHKKYLAQYVTMFQWAHNLKRVTDHFLRAIMVPRFIYLPI